MNLLVDTSVWSLFLRRQKRNEEDPYVMRLRYFLEGEDCIHLIGPILQELLDGIKVADFMQNDRPISLKMTTKSHSI